jgi:hypothetical protein
VWVELLLLLSIGGSAGLAWRILRRPDSGPATYWVTGWLSAGAGGVLGVVHHAFPTASLASHPLGSLFPALLVAGALILASRPVPRWLFPLALACGMMRAGFAAAGRPDVLVALAIDRSPCWWRPGCPSRRRTPGRALSACSRLPGRARRGERREQRLARPCTADFRLPRSG